MTRQFAADDYEAIRKSMEGLRPLTAQPTPEAIATASDSQALAIVKCMAIMPRKMTNDEGAIVAQAFDCRSASADPKKANPGCGQNSSWNCVKQMRCMTTIPRA